MVDPKLSLFQRLHRYPRLAHYDPAENRLTEALAATLSAAPRAAEHIITHTWGCSAAHGPPRCTTQVHVPDTGFVDLQLEFSEGTRCLVWVEIKRDAGKSGADQLERYSRALNKIATREGRQTRLIYLTRGGTPHAPAHPASWMNLGQDLHAWAEEAHADERHDSAMVQEFVRFLVEEQLTVTHALTPEGIDALKGAREARVALNFVIENALESLAKNWRTLDCDRNLVRQVTLDDKYPTLMWRAFAAQPDGAYPECDFDIVLDLFPEVSDDLQFGVGLVEREPRREGPFSNETWLIARESDGFRWLPYDGSQRLYRFMPLRKLGEIGELKEQVEELHSFIDSAYAALRDNPPPVPRAI